MAEPLKNHFGADVVRRLATELATASSAFNPKSFTRDALRGFDALELLDRGRHLARVMQQHLPGDFERAVDIILATLPERKEPAGGMASFFYLPHTDFIRQFGLAHFEPSMRGLHALTQVFTGEQAIRPFLDQHEARTLAQLHEWTRDGSEHVRRLVSEGTRSRLPWAPRLRSFQRDPAPVIELLELLKDDPALYVRRSVANNLNDIGKDHPKLLVQTTAAWMQNASAERRWIVQHALRSSVKKGDPAALKVLGFSGPVSLEIEQQAISPTRPAMGGKVLVSLTLKNPSRRAQNAVVDLVVHFVKANGSTTPKVFKLAVLELQAGASQPVRKTISLADLTTRKHYPGKHRIELQVNGVVQPLGAFTLTGARGTSRGSVR